MATAATTESTAAGLVTRRNGTRALESPGVVWMDWDTPPPLTLCERAMEPPTRAPAHGASRPAQPPIHPAP
jgi:hypothetical protein